MSAAQMATMDAGPRPPVFAVPATPFVMKPAPQYGARSVSTFRGGLPPSGYQLERRALSPIPMRWVSPIRVRGGPTSLRSFSPSRQGSPLALRTSRGIVFPGAAVLRPPLLPVDQHVKAMPTHCEEGQIRKLYPRTISPARSPMTVPAATQVPLFRVSSPTPSQRWPVPVVPVLHMVRRPSDPPPMELKPTQELKWQPPQLPCEPLPLMSGQVIMVGKMALRVGEAIGEGAYARVFSAVNQETGQEVAVKEMRCGRGAGILPDASVQRAMFEVKVMRQLTDASEDASDLRVPRLLDHQIWDLSPREPGAYLCRVVMTRRDGQALISWLQERCLLSASACLPSMCSYCASFMHAAAAARELLCQLAPTFQELNGRIAMHRDVNARNLLVACTEVRPCKAGVAPGDASALEFTLLDFGSSVDFHAWSSGSGAEGSWDFENPTGDARYWGPASWIRFLCGSQALEGSLETQYSRNLDSFALAICALETLAKLHTERFPMDVQEDRMMRESDAQERDVFSKKVALLDSIQQFHNAWSRYWKFAVAAFESLAEYSQLVCLGEHHKATQAWKDLSSRDIPASVQTLLHALCRDLVSLAHLCRQHASDVDDQKWWQVGDVLEVIRDMLHEEGSAEWHDVSVRLAQRPLSQSPRPGSPTLGMDRKDPAANSGASTRRRSLAEAASMAFSVMTAGLFWQNGSEEPPPREDEKENSAGYKADDLEEVHASMAPITKLTTEEIVETALQDKDGPDEARPFLDAKVAIAGQAAVLTPPVARRCEGAGTEDFSLRMGAGTQGTATSPETLPRGESTPQPPASRGAAAKSALHRDAGCSALQFPDARAITPRRSPSVRVIHRSSSPGTSGAAVAHRFPAAAVWAEPPSKSWCRTPPPGPVAQSRPRQPFPKGAGYPDDIKNQVQQLPAGDPAWQLDPRVAPVAPSIQANSWQFQGTMPGGELSGLHFAVRSR